MHRHTLAIMLSSGVTHAAEPAMPQLAPNSTLPSEQIAHIYYNVATGEKVATLLGDIRSADQNASDSVWISDNSLPCAAFGQTVEVSVNVDTIPCTTCFSSSCDSPRRGRIYMDWGDIPSDQVIDCVGVSWSTHVADTDFDGDGVGDGVEGFGARWVWTDAYNGFSTSPDQFLLTAEVILTDLPGALEPFDPSTSIAVYFATVDLDMDQGIYSPFELGDTDLMDASGSGRFNPGSGADLDSDGLADFGYGIQFIQPGTQDLDGDGVIDGDHMRAATSGLLLATPQGEVVQTSDGSWSFEPWASPSGQGAEDAYEVWTDCNGALPTLVPFGTRFFGGFSCDVNGDGVTGDTSPYAQFYTRMYGPGSACTSCPADIFPDDGTDCGGDGVLNFFDVSVYFGWFNSQNPRADLFPSAGGDGMFDFFDINAFITAFASGCP